MTQTLLNVLEQLHTKVVSLVFKLVAVMVFAQRPLGTRLAVNIICFAWRGV